MFGQNQLRLIKSGSGCGLISGQSISFHRPWPGLLVSKQKGIPRAEMKDKHESEVSDSLLFYHDSIHIPYQPHQVARRAGAAGKGRRETERGWREVKMQLKATQARKKEMREDREKGWVDNETAALRDETDGGTKHRRTLGPRHGVEKVKKEEVKRRVESRKACEFECTS